MIIRTRKNENFAILDKAMLADKRLSWKARGVLAYLMSKSDNWKVIITHLVSQSDKDGKDSVVAALKEMEDLGYLVRHQGRRKDGKMLPMEYWVHEVPVSPQPDLPVAAEPVAANPPLRSNEVNVGMILRENEMSKESPMGSVDISQSRPKGTFRSLATAPGTPGGKKCSAAPPPLDKILKHAEEWCPRSMNSTRAEDLHALWLTNGFTDPRDGSPITNWKAYLNGLERKQNEAINQ